MVRAGFRFREHPDYSIVPEKVANHLNHTPFIRQSRIVFQNEEDIVLRTRIAVKFSADYKRLFFLHNEADKSYLKVVGLKAKKNLKKYNKIKLEDLKK